MLPIFRISLNIQNGGTWRISFESPCRDEFDDVITFYIEPPDVADFSYLIRYSKWRHVTHIIREPSLRWVWWRHHFPHRTSGCCRFFVSHQILKNDGTWIIPFESPWWAESDVVITFRIERPHVADLSYLIKYKKWRHVTHIIRKPSPSLVRWRHHFPIFCISLNIQNGGTWRISFESPRRDESEDVITFRIEPPHVADFSYMIKYSKWWHATHIIRKAWPRWARWRHHFRYRTSGCHRFFVSH